MTIGSPMRRRRPTLDSRSHRSYLYTLVGLSLLALILPSAWTGRLISAMQLLVPFQDAAGRAADAARGVLDGDGKPVSGEVYDSVVKEREGLKRQTASLAIRVAELEREVEVLTAVRLWEIEGRRIGARGQLVPAGVVADDLLPWRSSKLVNAGTLQGVRRGAAVVSRQFSIDRGEASGVRSGQAVLIREVFLGIVDQAGTHTARVKLLSDITSGMKVRIGRSGDDAFVPLEGYFWLIGRGHGRMDIRDAKRRDVDTGLIRIGDLVLSDPSSDILPAPMVIGRITDIEPDHDNPLLSILTVQSAIQDATLRNVYVYNPDSTPNPASEAP